MSLSRRDVEEHIRRAREIGANRVFDQVARALLALDKAARVAVETWDEVGQEGEPYVEGLRAALLPEGGDRDC